MFNKLLLIGLLSFPVFAIGSGHVNNALITSVYCGFPGPDEKCAVEFNQDFLNKPEDSCHTTDSRSMLFKVNDDIGKAMLSIALTAYSTQKTVDIYSSGTCNITKGLYDIKYIKIK